MPQIREYTNTKIPEGNPFESTAYSIERYGRINQENIEKGANAVAQVSDAVQAHNDRLNIANLSAAMSQTQADNEKKFQDFQANHPYDPADPDKAYNDFFDHVSGSYDKLKTLATGTKGEDFINEAAAREKATWGKAIYGFQAQEEHNRIVGLTNAFHDNQANMAAFHPEQAADLAAQSRFYNEAMLPPEHVGVANEQSDAHIATSAVSGATASLMKIPLTGNTPEELNSSEQELRGRISGALNHFATDPFLQKAAPGTYEKSVADLTDLQNRLPAMRETQQRLADADAARVDKQVRDIARTDLSKWMLEHPNFTYQQLQQQAYSRADDLGGEGLSQVMEMGRSDLAYRHGLVVEARTENREARVEARDKISFEDAHTQAVKNGIIDGTVSEDEVYALGRGPNAWPLAKVEKYATFARNVKKSIDASDGYAGQSKAFHDGWRAKIVGDLGGATEKAAAYDAEQEVIAAENKGRERNLTPQQMFDPKSKDYIGGPYERALQSLQGPGIQKYQAIINNHLPPAVTGLAPTAAPQAPTGVDAKVWSAMTPEERALWQKK